ncbi:hypothetical protein ABT336_24650 [Micromonospora sp. NPDC000207]|uniref:hypothetical protein n=1 Tax=Micromonospora sp. NPDC000207 TaxID=3154246 RepID=UPI00331FC8CD
MPGPTFPPAAGDHPNGDRRGADTIPVDRPADPACTPTGAFTQTGYSLEAMAQFWNREQQAPQANGTRTPPGVEAARSRSPHTSSLEPTGERYQPVASTAAGAGQSRTTSGQTLTR